MALTSCPECKAPVSTDAKSCPHCGKRLKTGGGCLPAIIVLFILACISLLASLSNSPGPTPRASPTSAPEPDRRTLARQYTKIRITSLEKAGFDNVMVISAVISNHNTFAVKDGEVTCTPVAKSGTNLAPLRRVIYEKIAAKGERHITKFSMGIMSTQSHQASCEVTDVQPD